jgi:hypothetical protein
LTSITDYCFESLIHILTFILFILYK